HSSTSTLSLHDALPILLKRQLEIVRDGGEPTINVFRDPVENQGLESPAIPNEFHHWPNLAGRSGDSQPRNTARVRNQDGSPRERSEEHTSELQSLAYLV